jgi:hypothetical protein
MHCRLFLRIRSIKKKMNVDILIVRVNGSNSKPCLRCIKYMYSLRNRIKINNVYYSNKNDNGVSYLEVIKFNDLIKDNNPHICIYDKNCI